jgi:hypothetical protein
MSTEYLMLSKVIDNGVNGSTIPLFLVSAPVISSLPAFVTLDYKDATVACIV